ncbi:MULTISPECIES: cytochrome c-type biogenesis protein [unclassified Psychrobacter]|uniref:cytochrome c-type biogenesis protein n=1 Tax=unclassified Psychrobacter TaxID=196806 RepID=UPI003FD058F1
MSISIYNVINKNGFSKRVIRLASVLLALVLSLVIGVNANAAIDVYDFDSVQQEAQYRGLIEELRCPKCQNQNLAGSDAPIAQDLKQKTYDMVKDGRSDGEIRVYMQERYGDFISYKPPVRPSTWILWFFPPLLLILLIGGWFWQSRRRQIAAQSQTGTAAEHTEALSAAEKAELDRLLSRSNARDRVDHDITSIKDKK